MHYIIIIIIITITITITLTLTTCHRLQTPLEIMIDGLRHNGCKEMSLGYSKDRGRTVHAKESISKGDFVAEYKYSMSYPRKNRAEMEGEYEINGEGCYVIDIQLPGGKWVCIDATRNYWCWARYINHAVPSNANIKMFKPLLIKGKWRVGFVAIRDIRKGEELLYDYGVQPNPPTWLRRRVVRGVPSILGITSTSDIST